MKYGAYLWAVLGLCLIAIAGLIVKVASLSEEMRNLSDKNGRTIASLQDAVKLAQAGVAAAKDAAPGLGEFMTTIQLHAGKLWFAAKASNWELAEYELDELKETMEAVKTLNVEKNGVKISNVIDSVLKTQVAQLAESINRKSQPDFLKNYDEALSACNGCHAAAGLKFIRIVRPTAAPVMNQKWDMESK